MMLTDCVFFRRGRALVSNAGLLEVEGMKQCNHVIIFPTCCAPILQICNHDLKEKNRDDMTRHDWICILFVGTYPKSQTTGTYPSTNH